MWEAKDFMAVVALLIIIIAVSPADEYESKELCEENLARNEFCHNVWVKSN